MKVRKAKLTLLEPEVGVRAEKLKVRSYTMAPVALSVSLSPWVPPLEGSQEPSALLTPAQPPAPTPAACFLGISCWAEQGPGSSLLLALLPLLPVYF